MMTNDARCKHENKSRISMAKASFNKKTLHQQIELKFEEEASKVLHVENSSMWYSNLDTSYSRAEIQGKF
jgi:hypothetical protein